MQLKPVEEQVVALMGASSGIDRETALRLAERDAGVVVSAEAGLLPGWPLRVERRVVLTYRPPLSALVDELWTGAHGSWLGRFRMSRRGYNGTGHEEEKPWPKNRG